jgi:hypothetical protein
MRSAVERNVVMRRIPVLLLPLWAFMACSKVNFTFPFAVTNTIMMYIGIYDVIITRMTLCYM